MVLCYKTGLFKCFAVPVILVHTMKFESYTGSGIRPHINDDVDADDDLDPNPIAPTVLPIPVPQLTTIHSATMAQAALSIRPGGPDITVPPPPGPPEMTPLDTSPIMTAISKQ